MSDNITATKTSYGWRVSTTVMLCAERKLELEVVTMKRQKGPSTVASVSKLDGHFEVHAMHTDFSKWLTTHDSTRWTESEARKKHQVALDAVGGLKSVVLEAKQHYNIA